MSQILSLEPNVHNNGVLISFTNIQVRCQDQMDEHLLSSDNNLVIISFSTL